MNSLIVDSLMKQYDTYMVVFELEGKYWTRLSCQVFNEVSDYEFVAKKYLELLDEYQRRKQGQL